jgi:hypothetical protein
MYERETGLRYAADAGMEDALWRAQNESLPFVPGEYDDEYSYVLADDINGNSVNVSIRQIWPLAGLESDTYGTEAPDSLAITGGIINLGEGKFKVQISYDGTGGELPVDKVAVWLPTRFEYVAGSASGITTDEPAVSYERGGRVLTWEFCPAVDFLDLPVEAQGGGGGFLPGTEYPATRKLYFNVTPEGDAAGGSFCWVRTTDTDLYLAWETGCTIYQVDSKAEDSYTGREKSLTGYTYFSEGMGMGDSGCQIRGGYRAIGNSLMCSTVDPKIRDVLLPYSSANITDIPADGEVVLAYLYWSGWRDYEGAAEADTTAGLSINGTGVYFDGDGLPAIGGQDIEASRYWLLENSAPDYSYSCFKDVTDLVKYFNPQGNGEYTVSGVTANTTGEWSYAGWSLLIFYSSPAEPIRQIFLYDQFMFAGSYSEHEFDIEGFSAPADAEAVLTCFVGEGDEHYGWPHWFTGHDWLKFNEYYLYDAVNPQYNVWNGLSSGLGGLSIDGVDIDSFNVSSPIINQGENSATVELGTGVDNWNLIYILLAFTSEYGGLTPNASGIISYSGG